MKTKYNKLFRLAGITAASIALSGCANYAGISSQSQLRDAASVGLEAQTTQTPAPATDAKWWQAYGDSQLDQLIARAEQDSPSLRLAQARLRRALSATQLAESAKGPQVNASLDATRQLYTKTGLIPAPLAGTIQDTATLQLGASWELDLFGKNHGAMPITTVPTR